MANANKSKGDQAERDAVDALVALDGDLVDVHKAERLLGAGRKEDESDLKVFRDVAIQVRFYPNAGTNVAVRTAAADAMVQAANAHKPLGLGLVKYPNARAGSLRWLACTRDETQWPTGAVPIEPYEFTMASKLFDWLRTDIPPYGFLAHPREHRFARLVGRGADPVLIAPLEAWVASYRQHRAQTAGTIGEAA